MLRDHNRGQQALEKPAKSNLMAHFRDRRPFLNTFEIGASVTTAAIDDNKNQQQISINTGSIPPYTLSKQQFLYVVLTSIFVTCLIVADVVGVKLFEFKLPFPILGNDLDLLIRKHFLLTHVIILTLGHTSVEHTCGMLTFPVTFLLGDIINEYYVRNNFTITFISLIKIFFDIL
jgi:hypothetical protein